MRGAYQGPAQAAGARVRGEEPGRGGLGSHRVSLSGSAPAFVHERVCIVQSGGAGCLPVSLCALECKPCKPSLRVCCASGLVLGTQKCPRQLRAFLSWTHSPVGETGLSPDRGDPECAGLQLGRPGRG